MPDDWKTPSTPRLVGHLNDAHGHSIAVSADRGDVIIRRGGQDICLGAEERELFMRIYMEAERQAEVVEAEIWCGVRACINGPGDHLLADSCRDGHKAPGPVS